MNEVNPCIVFAACFVCDTKQVFLTKRRDYFLGWALGPFTRSSPSLLKDVGLARLPLSHDNKLNVN